MQQININGIKWQINWSKNEEPDVYIHKNIKVFWHQTSGKWRAQDLNGKTILSNTKLSDCLNAISISILEVYAERFRPSWDFSLENKTEEQPQKEIKTLPYPIRSIPTQLQFRAVRKL